eukprot:gnl/TRDRNA2_/TRDRNA2_175668_c0_seq35.p1 gnl/TRDRNA2_/TRDRNA2_175668_c0~~gnl/TRDRNA2_/TRDRNA2_175668_c0_seq35.p1  ORF type:complete len:379 (-),score=15.75 gnl/TRDRNA2_/TRDRNA2_175668_c0_seq35:106-1242(-)
MQQSCFLAIVLLMAPTGPSITADSLRMIGPPSPSLALPNISITSMPTNRTGIPLRIIVTAPYPMTAPEYKRICKNINEVGPNLAMDSETPRNKSLEAPDSNTTIVYATKKMMLDCAISRFQEWAPPGTVFDYYTDADMKESVRQLSKELELAGIEGKAFDAFNNLRPAAFRSDLWRLMQLWYYGGVYLDMNIKLKAKLSSWIDFNNDHLVLVEDSGSKRSGYWNAMMASTPQSPFIVEMIRTVTGNIKSHYYGNNPLCITGPIALYQALEGKHIGKHGAKLRVQYDFNHLWNDEARDIATHKHVIATKDQWLHHLRRDPKTAEVTHYSDMWYSREVYCDEQYAHPEFVPHGMCGPVKIPERNFTLPQDRRHGKLTVAD